MSRFRLDDAQRYRLAGIADVVAPRTDRMPSATDVGLGTRNGCLDQAVACRPDLAVRVLAVLDDEGWENDPGACLDRLGETSPADLLAVVELIAGAYFMAPEVQDRIGYQGQQAFGLGRGEIGGEDLLESMMARPPRWRRPPASSASGAGTR